VSEVATSLAAALAVSAVAIVIIARLVIPFVLGLFRD
jgi:hypothetical protein